MNAFGVVTPQQKAVRCKHIEDTECAERFIKLMWPVPEVNDKPFDVNTFVTYAVSTTLHSSLLLIAKGSHSIFTRGTYSDDPKKPWLIFQHAKVNQGLAQHVQEAWDNMAIHQNGNRAEVDKIAAHVLYQKQNGNWVFVLLPQSDSSNVVRFTVNDLEIWSHPPRDEPLKTVLEEMEGFKQAAGDLKQSAKALNDIKGNTKIPQDRKPQAVQSKLDETAKKFSQIYNKYYKSVKIPDSYKWPTLQLGMKSACGTTGQRYGGTFAGVFGSYANEVHMPFYAPGVVARELPTQETIFYHFLPQEKFNLGFEEVITSDHDK